MNGFLLQFDAENAPLEHSLEGSHIRLLPTVATLPEVNKTTERADEEHPGTACGIQDAFSPRELFVGQREVEHQARDQRRSKHSTLTSLGEVLVEMAQNFHRNITK